MAHMTAMNLLIAACVLLSAALIAVCISFAMYRKKAKKDLKSARMRAININFPKKMFLYCSEILDTYPGDCLIWNDAEREEYLVELYRIMLDQMYKETHRAGDDNIDFRSLRLLWDLRRHEYRYLKAVISYYEENDHDGEIRKQIRMFGPSRIYKQFDEFLRSVPVLVGGWRRIVLGNSERLDTFMNMFYKSEWYEPRTLKNTENPEKYGF